MRALPPSIVSLLVGLTGACGSGQPTETVTANITTFAGTGLTGSANGSGSAASFKDPTGIAVDSAGNVYVADAGNNLIRVITPAAVVTTLAGDGTVGSADGSASAASFSGPNGVAVGSGGAVYVADSSNNLIRMVSSAGDVTTIAGTGAQGSANGAGSAASFFSPGGVAVTATGEIFVADGGNNLIREVSSAGAVTTFAGDGLIGSADGAAADASFDLPYGVAVDSAGNLYIGDFNNNLVREVTSAGVVSTVVGAGDAMLDFPAGVAVDAAGNVYIADSDNNVIREISAVGVISTVAGNGTVGSADGSDGVATFDTPTGVAVDAAGNIYVADGGNNLIRLITPVAVAGP
jgi:serine/threonine protein kinase, bacterial